MTEISIVAAELRGIFDRTGSLTPQAVVDASRPRTAPLHERFEWNDKVAGEAFRCVQAASLIRHVKITIVQSGGETVSVRAFPHVPADVSDSEFDDSEDSPRGNYIPQDVVANSPRLTALALREMERRWHQLRRTYQDHAEFWELVKADSAA